MNNEYAKKVMDYEYNMFMSVMHVSVSKHLFDEHFTVVWANDYFYELIGYSKEEYTALFHNHVDEYYKDDPESAAYIAGVVRGAYERNEEGYEFESRMPASGGRVLWIRGSGRFTDELQNGFPIIYSIYTDITDLKQLQLDLEERTGMLHDALVMAERANRAKSDFLSRMSHDIRTPMNAIIGMTDIASCHLDDPDKMQDCLRKIALSSQHLLGLINDVLDMSKIESGKMTLNVDSMSLPELLENVIAIMQPNIKSKRQNFSIRLHNVIHEQFICDALRLRQVFINILSNANKFTSDCGTITLDVEEKASADPDIAEFSFIFCDTGIGMRPEFIEHIFDAFTREQDSRVDKTEGSGLGMAITKKIVEMLDGLIEVTSEPGKGTCFQISLPLQIDASQSVEIEFPPLKILVVDDDDVMCRYTVKMLRESCGEGAYAVSGSAAVDQIVEAHRNSKDFDAVILDWQMPGQDGIQTARRIRDKAGDKLPILIVSAYDWADIEEEALAAGVNGFIPKPVFRSTLLRGLRRYVLGQKEFNKGTESAGTYKFTGRRFLLVEDNEFNRDVALEILTFMGAVVECACNGAEGVEKFTNSPEEYYDLLLMDVQMPVMDGYAATRKIRGLLRKDAAAVPILALTADAFAEDISAAKEAGMSGHLAKPFNMAAIGKEISRVLDQPGIWAKKG